jgi:hypothetical protein
MRMPRPDSAAPGNQAAGAIRLSASTTARAIGSGRTRCWPADDLDRSAGTQPPRLDSAPGNQATRPAAAIRLRAPPTAKATGSGRARCWPAGDPDRSAGMRMPRPDSAAPGNQAAGAIRIGASTTARATAAGGQGAGQLMIWTEAPARNRPAQIQHQAIKQHDQQQRSGSAHRPPPGQRQRTDKVLARW